MYMYMDIHVHLSNELHELWTEDVFDIIRAVAMNQTQPGCLYSQLRQDVVELLTEKR